MSLLKVGDKVKFIGCPYDEQISEELEKWYNIKNQIHTIVEVKDTSDMNGTTGQWVKTDLEPEWIDKVWYC